MPKYTKPDSILVDVLKAGEEGKLDSWHVGEGDEVTTGQVVANIGLPDSVIRTQPVHFDCKIEDLLVAVGGKVQLNSKIASVLRPDGETDPPGDKP